MASDGPAWHMCMALYVHPDAYGTLRTWLPVNPDPDPVQTASIQLCRCFLICIKLLAWVFAELSSAPSMPSWVPVLFPPPLLLCAMRFSVRRWVPTRGSCSIELMVIEEYCVKLCKLEPAPYSMPYVSAYALYCIVIMHTRTAKSLLTY